MSTITKAIIATAGWGIRRLPITKSIEKAMLPVGNRPLVDYVVQDCIKAGIRDIYLVVNQGNSQVRSYYSDNSELSAYLSGGRQDEILRSLALPNVNFHFIEQPRNSRYGTAIPVSLVAPELKPGESVVMMTGDDFIYNRDGSSEVARLIEATPEGGNSMLAADVGPKLIGRYGAIQFDQNNNFVQIVEKPAEGQAPSTWANISKYVLNYDMVQSITNYSQLDMSGEYYITEPINQYVYGGGSIKVVGAAGQYLDGGNVYSWLAANNAVLNMPSYTSSEPQSPPTDSNQQ
ncbi:MAG: hypothetical protein L0H36_03585 [bacterium]|nr:hypothetical protein [bacterium]